MHPMQSPATRHCYGMRTIDPNGISQKPRHDSSAIRVASPVVAERIGSLHRAATPQNPLLTDNPSSATSDGEPSSVNATVNPATPETSVYLYPPVVNKKPCLK